jgi:hypothetical protein
MRVDPDIANWKPPDMPPTQMLTGARMRPAKMLTAPQGTGNCQDFCFIDRKLSILCPTSLFKSVYRLQKLGLYVKARQCLDKFHNRVNLVLHIVISVFNSLFKE